MNFLNSQKGWILCCFFNFLIASYMGLLMRFLYLFPLKDVNYAFLLHAHSHTAMLGWGYLMIYVLIVHFFISKEKQENPIYNRLFWLTEFSVIGMMLSFPVQGYALFSIVFSTLHIVLSYIFCWLVWRDCYKEQSCSKLVLFCAILFMLFSTLGVWCLGPAVKTLGKQSAFYQIAIQFFLHFQFNGWFLFAIIALFLKQFKEKMQHKAFTNFFVLLITAVFFTVCFPISWFVQNKFLIGINTLGVLLQLIAFFFFYKMLCPQIKSFMANLNPISKIAYRLALTSLFMKIVMQLFVLIPDFSGSLHQVRNFVIGFIHLTSLGIITGFLLGILIQNKMLNERSYFLRVGIKCFIFGYTATEVLLFLQGSLFYFNFGILPAYYWSIFMVSLLIVFGLILITASLINKKTRVDF